MASVRLSVLSKTYSDGTKPIAIRFLHNRKAYTKVIAKVHPEHIAPDITIKKSHPLHVRLNRILMSELKRAQMYLLDCQQDDIEPDPKLYLSGDTDAPYINDALQRKSDTMHTRGQYRSAAKYRTTLSKVAEFDIPISKIDTRWLERFVTHLTSLGNNTNTVAKELSCIRTVLNENRHHIEHDPFDTFQIKRQKAYKVKLTKDEFDTWCNAELSGMEATVRDLFALAVLFRGMRAFDILTLRWEQISGDRLYYKASKTGKVQDMKIVGKAQSILSRYSGDDYVFPFVKWPYVMYDTHTERFLRHVNSKNAMVNKYLKQISKSIGIDKNVTMHTARHTFGYLADRAGLSMTVIQNLYAHSSLKITEQYIQELRKSDELDREVDKMF